MIEMILAMTFVSFLMITIALTTISMAHTYQRGIMLSQVNRAGRAVITDLQRTVSQAPIRHDQADVTHGANALCFGSFSYVWNTGASIAASTSKSHDDLITYTGGGDLSGNVVRLAKVNDPGESMCATHHGGMLAVPADKSTELLPSDSSDSTAYDGIAVQGPVSASQLTFDGTQALYSVSFILGTNDQTALNKVNFATAPSCKPPSEGNLSYCAVNKFQFLIRAGGGHYDATN